MTDIHAEKYSVIEALMKVNDISLIQRVKSILSSNQETITKAELIERAKVSNSDIKAGRVKTLQQVQQESKDW